MDGEANTESKRIYSEIFTKFMSENTYIKSVNPITSSKSNVPPRTMLLDDNGCLHLQAPV